MQIILVKQLRLYQFQLITNKWKTTKNTIPAKIDIFVYLVGENNEWEIRQGRYLQSIFLIYIK